MTHKDTGDVRPSGPKDIVERLRDPDNCGESGRTAALEAAAEIERLRDALNGVSAAQLTPCTHPRAEYDSGGAWCPDCNARGTFPGMG